MKKGAPMDVFCFTCESRILTKADEFGPICKVCFQKAKRPSPLARAARRGLAVVSFPTICPHDRPKEKHRCRFDRATPTYFNVLVLDENLEPVEIAGPFHRGSVKSEISRMRAKYRRKDDGDGKKKGKRK